MVKERFLTPSAVYAGILKDKQVLLQKRKNTGYRDGYYDFAASGHVENSETLLEAVIREAKEELGIDVKEKDIKFMTLVHRKDPIFGTIYYDTYFLIQNFTGELIVKEPDKCEELKWFDIDKLPGNLIPDRRFAWDNYIEGVPYGEYGWK